MKDPKRDLGEDAGASVVQGCRRAITACAFGLLLFAVQPAVADVFGVVLQDGFSKDNPTNSPIDNSSSFGATLAGSTITFDTDTGILRADLFNSGNGTMTGFGLALSSAFTGLTAAFSFTPGAPCVGCNFVVDSPASNDTAGPFDNAEPGGFDVGTEIAQGQGGVSKGLKAGERATFIWDFDASFAAIDSFIDGGGSTGVVNLLEVPDTGGLTTDGSNESAFWVAHIQQLGPNDNDSDRIGGTARAIAEPGMLALFGVGLIGLAALRRRSKPNTHFVA